MALSTNNIVRHLFKVGSLEEVSRQQLQELVQEYPSFGIGRYLLSRKLQAETAEEFKEETQKTNLYFSNPFWLGWLLQNDGAAVEAPPHEEPLAHHAPDEAAAHISEQVTREIAEQVADDLPEAETPPISLAAVALEQLEVPAESDQSAVVPEPELPLAHIEDDPDDDTPVVATEQRLEALHGEPQTESAQSIHTFDTDQRIHALHGEAISQREVEHQPKAEAQPEVEPQAQVERQSEVEPWSDAAHPVQTSEPREEIHPAADQPLLTPNGATAPQGTASAQPAAVNPPLFEPYHTVDYFASQGIRLVLDENPTDKLGRQMKSFTDWLKVMRKLPQSNRETVPDLAAEHQVQTIAAHSIEQRREVVTETMAEVLAKQGMREKATEMYRKLSLLEPEKSAYFADKIEKLKIR